MAAHGNDVPKAEEARIEYDALDRSGEAEPWEPWETKLVLYSIGIGIVVLVIGGWLVNHFILSGH